MRSIVDIPQTGKKKSVGFGIIVACMCTHTSGLTHSHTHTLHMRVIDNMSQTGKKKSVGFGIFDEVEKVVSSAGDKKGFF